MSFLKPLFADKLVYDEREPALSFQVPGIGGEFHVLAPMMEPWSQLGALVLLQISLLSTFAAIIHVFIIRNRGQLFAFLLGYGLVIPLALVLPFQIIEYFRIYNTFARFALFTLPTQTTFRCIEAMHGTSPPVVEHSIGRYMLYYSSTFDFVWDKQTKKVVKIPTMELLRRLGWVLFAYLNLSMIYSFMLHYNFKPFPTNVQVDKFNITWELLTPAHIANNYLYAVMTYLALDLGFNKAALLFNALGYSTYQPFFLPLWLSKSPTDFWSRRWNMTIHETLKRGVYLPLRKSGFAKSLALVSAFVASGLLHDYCWIVMFYKASFDRDDSNNCEYNCFDITLGKQTAFFLVCGVVFVFERPVGKLSAVQWMSKNLPVVVVSTLIVLIVTPVAHWFAGDWIVGGLFRSYSLGLMVITYES